MEVRTHDDWRRCMRAAATRSRGRQDLVTWLDRYVSYDYLSAFVEAGWGERDAVYFVRFMDAMYDDLELSALGGSPTGHAVGYLARRLGMRMEYVNHCQHLAQLFGMLRKDSQLYSRVKHRPDRFHVEPGVTYERVREVLGRLAAVGITTLRRLIRKKVEEAGFDTAGIYRRGRGSKGHPLEVQLEEFEETYEHKHWEGRRLDEIVTSRPESLAPHLPPGCELEPLPGPRRLYHPVGRHANRYVVYVAPLLDESMSNVVGRELRIFPDVNQAGAALHRLCRRYEGLAADDLRAAIPHYVAYWMSTLGYLPVGYRLVEAGAGRYCLAPDPVAPPPAPARWTRDGIQDGMGCLPPPLSVPQLAEERGLDLTPVSPFLDFPRQPCAICGATLEEAMGLELADGHWVCEECADLLDILPRAA